MDPPNSILQVMFFMMLFDVKEFIYDEEHKTHVTENLSCPIYGTRQ